MNRRTINIFLNCMAPSEICIVEYPESLVIPLVDRIVQYPEGYHPPVVLCITSILSDIYYLMLVSVTL